MASTEKIKAYFLPGQAADSAIFRELILPAGYQKCFIEYPVPDKTDNMKSFAQKLISQIDTTTEFVLIGQSLGGMLAVELSELIPCKKVVIIASAKSNNDLPKRYSSLKKLPIHRVIPAALYKMGAIILQPIVEKDRNEKKEIFEQMLKHKSALFLKRSAALVIEWERVRAPSQIVHIHGTADRTIPYRNLTADFVVSGGSHMMVLTQAHKISGYLARVLN